MARKRRGSSMGKGSKKSRTARKSGKSWLTLPDKWGYFKEEADTTIKMDLLPYVVKKMKLHPEYDVMQEDVWYRYPYKLHRNVGSTKKSFLCPSTVGKPCPMCEKMQDIYDDPDINNKKAGKFRPAKRSLFIIKVKNGDKKFKGKKFIWDVSDANFFDHVDKEIDLGEEDWNNFACLEGGYTLKVRFIEESFDTTKYACADRIDFISRKDYKEKILDKNPCLDDMVVPNIPSYDELVDLMSSKDSDKKKGKKGKKGKKNKKNKIKWDDLEDMEEDELMEVAEDNGLDPDDLTTDDEEELRKEIAEELGIDVPEDDDDDNNDDDDDNDDNDDDNDNDDNDDDDNDDNDDDDNDDNDDDNDDNDDDNDNDDNDDDETPKEKKARLKKEKKAAEKAAKKDKKKDKKKGGKKDKKKGGKKGKKGSSSKLAMKCPFAYQYGEEWGDHPECDESECKKYNKCFKIYDKLQDDE